MRLYAKKLSDGKVNDDNDDEGRRAVA